VVLGSAYRLPALSVAGASLASPWLRFHIPLIKPDLRGIIPPLSHAPTVDGGQGELVVIIYSNDHIINISKSIGGDLTQGWP
jgi:hypothetical protein